MKELYNCRFTSDYRCPKNNGKNVIYKVFKQGSLVKAYPFNGAGLPSSRIQMFRTEDGFVIPNSAINVLGKVSQSNFSGNEKDIPYAEVVEDKPKIISLPKNSILSSDFASKIKRKSKSSVTGSIIGFAGGFVYAMAKGQNKLVFGVIGSVIGFTLGNLYDGFVNEEKK